MATSGSFTPGSRPRVLHFVTGGFSGATQVAVDLVAAHLESQRFEPLLVLRRKPSTQLERVQALRARGLPIELVPGWSHLATMAALVKICRRFRPDILVAHGFSDHLWGRYAGLLAGVPHLVHVEHNSRERYGTWRLRQALWLSRRTDLIVGCSEGVATALRERGFPPAKVVAIPNGIRLQPFDAADAHPWPQRRAAAVMAARFARQKDHATLLHAIALLRQQGLELPLTLAGTATGRHAQTARALASELGIADLVDFIGHCTDVPGLLMAHRVCVLSSHYEGMPLGLVEGMAAGCVPVGSDVVGIRELIDEGRTGHLAEPGDAQALATALRLAVSDTGDGATIAQRARQQALAAHGRALMVQRYEDAFARLLGPTPSLSSPA